MSAIKRTDVIVAGAGPVGMFTALCLKRHRVDVEIFDPLPRSSTHSYALALHPESLALFEKFGLMKRVEELAHPMEKIAIHLGKEQVVAVDLAGISGLDHPFVAVIPQKDLEHILLDALREAGVNVHWSHRIGHIEDAGRRVMATASELEERELGYAIGHSEQFVRKNHGFEAAFLVGADGHDSFVRRHLGIGFPEKGPSRQFAIFEFKGKGTDADTMQVFVNDWGLVSVRWPIATDTWRWSFEVTDDFWAAAGTRRKDPDLIQLINSARYPALGGEDLQVLIRERAPWCDASVDNLYWRLLIRFEKRLAERFGEGRIWLAGDAAHLTGPVGIQSMNVGLREGFDLAERIAAVIDARTSSQTLEEYNRERIAEWNFLHGATGKFRRHADTDSRLDAFVDPLRTWLPASGYGLATLARHVGFEVEDLPVGTGSLGNAV